MLLDTNVVSEVMRPAPDARVGRFLASRPLTDLFLPSLVVAEIQYGLARLSEGQRRQSLSAQFELLLAEAFAGRVLVFDARCAQAYAVARATRDRLGRPLQVQDALIGGMALAYGAQFATRNVADFDGYGLDLVNPWEAR